MIKDKYFKINAFFIRNNGKGVRVGKECMKDIPRNASNKHK